MSIRDTIQNSDSLRILTDINQRLYGPKFHTHTHVLYDIRSLLGDELRIYTEIGSFIGSSAALMLQHSFPTDIICIDPLNLSSSRYNFNLSQEQTLRDNLKLVNVYNNNITIHKNSSADQNFIRSLQNSDFKTDILFIDGDHSHKGVVNDFDNYHKFVLPGGYIVFDDYNDRRHCSQVHGAVNTIVQNIYRDNLPYEIIGVLPNYQNASPQLTRNNMSNEFIIKKL